MESLLFLLLISLCFIVSFVYNKKTKLIKKIVQSFSHAFFIAIFSLYVKDVFFFARYDFVEKYPNIPTVQVFTFLEYTLIFVIPLLYIVFVFILIKTDKK